jgi:hypothetical protein
MTFDGKRERTGAADDIYPKERYMDIRRKVAERFANIRNSTYTNFKTAQLAIIATI